MLSRRSAGAVSVSPTSAPYHARRRCSSSWSVIERPLCRSRRSRRAGASGRSGDVTGPCPGGTPTAPSDVDGARGSSAATGLDVVAGSHGSAGRALGADAAERPGPRRVRGAGAFGRLLDLLRGAGYEPEIVQAGDECLLNCPYDALVEEHRVLTCGMNQASAEGVVEGRRSLGRRRGAASRSAGRCCVTFHPTRPLPGRSLHGRCRDKRTRRPRRPASFVVAFGERLLVDLDVASDDDLLAGVVAGAQADPVRVGRSGLAQVLHVDPVVERAGAVDRRRAEDAGRRARR